MPEYEVVGREEVLEDTEEAVAAAALEEGLVRCLSEVSNSLEVLREDVDDWHAQPGATKRRKKAQRSVGATWTICLQECVRASELAKAWPVHLGWPERLSAGMRLVRGLDAYLDVAGGPEKVWGEETPRFMRAVTAFVRCLHLALKIGTPSEIRERVLEEFAESVRT